MSTSRFEFEEGTASKFWEITVTGGTITVRFGRLGSDGQASTKTFATPQEAQTQAGKQVAEKVRKGYLAINANASAPAKIQTPDDAMLAGQEPIKTGVTLSLEFQEGTSRKFWQVTVSGSEVSIRFGRISSDGQSSVKKFPDAKKAQEFADRQHQVKLSKGYASGAGTVARPLPPALAVDGTNLSEILRIAGGTGAITPHRTKTLTEIKAALGVPLPEELCQYIAMGRVELSHPDAAFPPSVPSDIYDVTIEDVGQWLKLLKVDLGGEFLALQHFCGLIHIGEFLQYGDLLQLVTSIDSYDGGQLGGVFYWDGNETGPVGNGSLSSALLHEMSQFLDELEDSGDGSEDEDEDDDEVDYSDLQDVCIFAAPIKRSQLKAQPPSPRQKKAWKKFVTDKGAQVEKRVRLIQGCNEHDDDSFPSPTDWSAQKNGLSRSYGDAMYWLVAHAVYAQRPQLKEALELTASHPSANVQNLRAYLQKHDISKRFRRVKK